jgi:hypothetical protein
MSGPVIPSTLNYRTTEKASPSYTFLKIPINSIPSGSFNLSFTTQSLVDFKLPNKVINLARSYIGYVNSYAADSASTCAWIPEDTTDLGIANISFMSSNGFDCMNLNYTTNFLKIAAKLGTDHNKVLDNGPIGDGVYLNSQLPNQSNYYPTQLTAQANNVYALTGTPILAINTSNEVQYLSTSSAINTALVKCRQFNLGAWFKDSVLSVDKDMFFGPQADMFLRFMVGGNKCGFASTTVANPSTGAAALTIANSVISDMYLYLAVETNQHVIASVMESFHSNKLVVQIPYTVGVKTALAASSVNNVSINITKNYGKYLKKIVHTTFNGTESANLNNDMSNWNGVKTLTYNTLFDQVQLQPMLVSCLQPVAGALNSNDYAYNKSCIKNSAIVGLGQYQQNWFHMDKFYDDQDDDKVNGNNLKEGLLLTDNHIWSFAGNNNGSIALNNYTFMTFTRDLHVSQDAGLVYV